MGTESQNAHFFRRDYFSLIEDEGGGKITVKKMKARLVNLALGEFVAVCIFIYVYYLLDLGAASLFAFAYLVFILLQGIFYWLYRYLSIKFKLNFHTQVAKTYRYLQKITSLLCLPVVLNIAINYSNGTDIIIAIAILIFSLVEYVNYFCYRLSYGKTGFNLIILKNHKLKKSSLHTLINRYARPS